METFFIANNCHIVDFNSEIQVVECHLHQQLGEG